MFVMQLDEGTGDDGPSILLVLWGKYTFVTSIEEDLLLCRPLETNTTGEQIFEVINKHNIN